jgi:NADH:ubiquinone oxidoreductase subunit K
MQAIDLSVIYMASFAILLVGYLTAISSKDLIRLLIALELMFGAVFMSLIPLFSAISNAAFGIAIITIFTSSSELLVLIAAIVTLDRQKKNVYTSSVTIGGDKV